jgi:hypothetical protein
MFFVDNDSHPLQLQSTHPHSLGGSEGSSSVWEAFFQQAGFDDTTSKSYAVLFKKHEIEMDMLPDLNHEVLLQMGILKAGHRIKILRMQQKKAVELGTIQIGYIHK